MKPPILAPKEISFEVSRDFVKIAARRLFLSQFRNSILLFWVGLLVALAFLPGFYAGIIQHNRQGLVYLVPLILWLLPTVFLVRAYANIRNKFLKSICGNVKIRVDHLGMVLLRNDSKKEMLWSNFTHISKCPEVWFVFFRSPEKVCFVLPTPALDSEMMNLIENSIRGTSCKES
jgi:hypothetical protein